MEDVKVFVLDKKKHPLMPCSPKRARELLRDRRAVVHKLVPFTIRMKDRVGGDVQPVVLSIDPGSKETGLAISRLSEPKEQPSDEDARGPVVHPLFLAELMHRGEQIKKSMEQRKMYRHIRRSKRRYREMRYSNRKVRKGWLAPSILHRAESVVNMARRFKKLVPISEIRIEKVCFDTQKMQNLKTEDDEYQHGTLRGYTLRGYVLERGKYQCAYCDKRDAPLEMEHVVARIRGGSRRPSNIVPACHTCNQKKDDRLVEEFLKKDPARLAKIKSQMKVSLRDAAAVNITRNALPEMLAELGVPVSTSSGDVTHWNRDRFKIPKSHALDAVCVGPIHDVVGWDRPTLYIKCRGRGDYARTKVNKHGIKRGFCMKEKFSHGFQTGDMVRANVTTGTKIGVYKGRVSIRKSGRFDISTATGTVQGLSHRFFTLLQRADGYEYHWSKIVLSRDKGASPASVGRASHVGAST